MQVWVARSYRKEVRRGEERGGWKKDLNPDATHSGGARQRGSHGFRGGGDQGFIYVRGGAEVRNHAEDITVFSIDHVDAEADCSNICKWGWLRRKKEKCSVG